MIRIGRIKGPWGREGALEIEIYSPFPERFLSVKEVYLDSQIYKIKEIRTFPKKIIIKLEGVSSIEDAKKLSAEEIEIPDEKIFALPNGYFYIHELEGCKVFVKGGDFVGTVKDVWEIGDNVLLSIYGVNNKEILVPFVKSICYLVDVQNKKIEIDPPEGLLNLNEV